MSSEVVSEVVWVRSDDPDLLPGFRLTVQKVRLAIYPEKFEPGPEFMAWLDQDDLWQAEGGHIINTRPEYIQVQQPTPPLLVLLNERMQAAADKMFEEFWNGTGRYRDEAGSRLGGLHSLIPRG